MSLVSLLVLWLPIDGQTSRGCTIEAGLATGGRSTVVVDERLNGFTYRGHASRLLAGTLAVNHKRSMLSVDWDYSSSQLRPGHVKTGYYQYNYQNNRDMTLSIAWLKTVNPVHAVMPLKIGVTNNFGRTFSTEYYYSNLYGGAGYKKTLLLSPVNLGPTLRADFMHGNHCVWAKAYWSVLSLVARPDDVYVRQTGDNGGLVWKLQSFTGHREALLRAGYGYDFGCGWKATLSYAFIYRNNGMMGQYTSIVHSVGAGIVKTF